MELRQLDYFVAVAEERHFTRAATRCHVSQSTLSASIRALENELDAALLHRTTRQVELTDAGRALLAEARRTLAAAHAARDAVHATKGLLWGSLAVGGVQTTGLFDQAKLLARFHGRYPTVDVHYRTGISSDLIDDLRNGRLDVGFVSLPKTLPSDLRARPLAGAPLFFVCRVDHALAERKSVRLHELQDETFVGAPAGSVANTVVGRVFSETGAEPKMPFVMSDVTTMLDFVASGLGVALLPEYLVVSRPELRGIRLADRAFTWTLGLVTPTPDRLTAPARALCELVD